MRELVFETDQGDCDEISDRLIELGALSVSVEDALAESDEERPIFGEPGTPTDLQSWPCSKVVVLLDPSTDCADFWERFCRDEPRFDSALIELRELSDRDWVSETQRQFTPLQIADRLWVGPHWTSPPEDFPNNAVRIQLDPGMAFGTGSHATTQLCLESMIRVMDHAQTPLRILDMGCGSGILAIAAAKLGTAEVLAVDIDPIAVATSEQNAQANHAVITAQDADQDIAGDFDLVVANILAQPLKVLAPTLTRMTRPSGQLLLSGILARQAEEILDVYRPLAAHLPEMHVLQERDGWVCIGTLINPNPRN